uniref:PGG domain-containing protein n=1 Tax=Populus trichocarpa TaxID=3694 RepID=A0A2K1WSH5_POPTR
MALITMVTFAAAFTLPGSYKIDQSTTILAKKAAFIVFVLSDAMSMVLSIFAVFIHFLISLIQGLEMDKNKDTSEDTIEILFRVATLFTMIGMETMIIAFFTGIYTVLEPFLGLAISICLIGLSFVFLVYLVFRIIYKDIRD